MKDIKPNYYRRTVKGVEIDVNDIADAFDLGYQAQNAIKYLVRAGRKDETTLVDDLIKARHYIDRLIKKHEEETNPEPLHTESPAAQVPFTMTPATPEQIAVASAWPCWVFTRLAPRDYTIAGPHPTREAARRALDPSRADQRVVMADDPYQVEADVVERLFT